jgi:hypothetical protein
MFRFVVEEGRGVEENGFLKGVKPFQLEKLLGNK